MYMFDRPLVRMAHKRTQVESSADLGFDGVSPQNLSQWVHNFLNQFKEGKTKIRGFV
jgi:hypothetical protein